MCPLGRRQSQADLIRRLGLLKYSAFVHHHLIACDQEAGPLLRGLCFQLGHEGIGLCSGQHGHKLLR